MQVGLVSIHLSKQNESTDHVLFSQAKSASRKLNIAEKRLSEARGVLDELKSTAGLAIEYFAEQWERQKKCQSELMADDSFQNLQSRLGRLIDLEEEFKEAHGEFEKLRRKRRRTLSEEEHATLRALPSTLVSLEDSITELAMDLGGDEFRDMPEVKDPQARMRLRIRVSKEKLYEAKVGKVEWQKKWDKPGIGFQSFYFSYFMLHGLISLFLWQEQPNKVDTKTSWRRGTRPYSKSTRLTWQMLNPTIRYTQTLHPCNYQHLRK
ncbi:hypothetical protein DFH28DRAFT_900048 [Melampsora americana]|nr:hypothetical protein DFH28DRAFT_900048 [Melampsora americana]